MASRLEIIRSLLPEHDCDAAVLNHLPSIRWAVGFTGSSALLFVTKTDAYFFSDSRYAEQARAEVSAATIDTAAASLLAGLKNSLGLFEGNVLIDDAKVRHSAYKDLVECLPSSTFVNHTGWLQTSVAQKTEHEIERLRDAQALNDRVFENLLDRIQLGRTEKEIAAEIACLHYRYGAEGLSFDPIVASGPNSALPHARPTERMLQHGDFLVIDMGSILDGYASDMTRTVVLGEASDDMRRVYDAVLLAQEAALSVACAGMTTGELEKVARDELDSRGLGGAFVHSLGHGIGLEVHEWPRVARHTHDILPVNCAITIEPGAYLAALFGVRIEDTVVLRPDGCENLTITPKEMVVV